MSVLAATENAVIVRKAIASQRIATPCAAVATAPRRLIRREEPELAEDIGQALTGRRQADPQEPADPVPGRPERFAR